MEADQSEIKETSQTLDRSLAPSWSVPWAVVLTMLAVEFFDPRLIWDSASSREVRYA
jgi:uncharacterized paraquat-inducible protein A